MRGAEIRTVHPGIRVMLFVGTAFVTFDFVQLTLLAERTDRYFSWTIDAPITAVVLGSFYFAAVILTLFGGTQRAWVRARAVVPGTWAFVTLVLIATLIHLDVFRPHLHSPDAITRFEFWVWIGAYTAEPVGLLVFGLLQRRVPGADPPRGEPWPPEAYLWIGTAAGGVATLVGGAMFLFPGTAIDPVVVAPHAAHGSDPGLVVRRRGTRDAGGDVGARSLAGVRPIARLRGARSGPGDRHRPLLRSGRLGERADLAAPRVPRGGLRARRRGARHVVASAEPLRAASGASPGGGTIR
ncbi:MAG: hypothetical protein ACRDGW_12125 [Actinomycetota bacterium]